MPSYNGDVSDEAECEQVCRVDRQCAAFTYSPPVCTIYGTVRTKSPDDGRDWAFIGGSVPMAVEIEDAIVVRGQRESVCRKKDEYGDKVLAEKAGKIEVTEVFHEYILLGFFWIMLLIFCVGPIFRCFRTCCCGVREKDMQKHYPELYEPRHPTLVHVRGQKPAAIADMPRDDKDLRATGQDPAIAPQQPMPLQDYPDAPTSPPHQLMPADPNSPQNPAQGLPLEPALPGAPEMDDAASRRSSPKKKGWSRPPPDRKQPQPAPGHEQRQKQPAPGGAGPNISPAQVGTGATFFPGLM